MFLFCNYCVHELNAKELMIIVKKTFVLNEKNYYLNEDEFVMRVYDLKQV